VVFMYTVPGFVKCKFTTFYGLNSKIRPAYNSFVCEVITFHKMLDPHSDVSQHF
jgi:hypothetical protein